jgi:aryl-alcohol dehydrogenase-like predicted oxidoreductase
MIYRRIADSDVQLSIVGLGGHEYLSNGRSRGFNELPELAVKPGYIMEGFGAERRKELLRYAYQRGINFFDATMDSEKDALGRNLQELSPPHKVYVQTRPEGLVYGRDPLNRKMADYETLQAEVRRGLGLLRRECLDLLNIAFMRPALEHDPQYLDKIGCNIAQLKAEGLIRFACLDTFSGEWTYLKGIEAGCFDGLFINFNLADDAALKAVFPAAQDAGMAILIRECFMKGELFHMGKEVGLNDRARLAQTALKWCLTREGVTLAVVGCDNASQLASNLEILEDLQIGDQDQEIMDRLRTSARFKSYRQNKRDRFFETE